jgi:predicted  nucleic acid-binding Zn-ribbon protein
MREPAGESPLDHAVKRLDRAISQLEQRLAGGENRGGGLFDQDAAKLSTELHEAREREKELEEAGAEASAALGRAIAEIKAALANENSEETEQTEEA